MRRAPMKDLATARYRRNARRMPSAGQRHFRMRGSRAILWIRYERGSRQVRERSNAPAPRQQRATAPVRNDDRVTYAASQRSAGAPPFSAPWIRADLDASRAEASARRRRSPRGAQTSATPREGVGVAKGQDRTWRRSCRGRVARRQTLREQALNRVPARATAGARHPEPAAPSVPAGPRCLGERRDPPSRRAARLIRAAINCTRGLAGLDLVSASRISGARFSFCRTGRGAASALAQFMLDLPCASTATARPGALPRSRRH